MDNRSWLSGASGTPPAAPGSPSNGYPTGGNPGVTPPTNPGPYWFHQVGEELRNVILAGGLTPNAGTLSQLRDGILAMLGTPVQILAELSFGGANTGITYSSRSGYALVYGKRVEFMVRMFLSSKGSATGAARFSLSYLPGVGVPAFPVPEGNTPCHMSADLLTGLTGRPSVMLLNSGNHEFRYFDGAAGDAPLLTNSNFQNNSVIYIAGMFFTA